MTSTVLQRCSRMRVTSSQPRMMDGEALERSRGPRHPRTFGVDRIAECDGLVMCVQVVFVLLLDGESGMVGGSERSLHGHNRVSTKKGEYRG